MKKRKIIIFSTLLVLMITYIGIIFYLSEPTYIDNCYKKVEKFDYVSVSCGYGNRDVSVGIVLQVDSTTAIIRTNKYNDLEEINFKTKGFRVIGKGTFYHKVNNYIGFNVMVITQIFIGILCAILIIVLVDLLKDILD